MDGRPEIFGSIGLFQAFVHLDEEMAGVDKIPQLFGGELEKGGVPAATRGSSMGAPSSTG